MVKSGVWVLTDRYVLSSLAYQAAQGVDLDWLIELNRNAPTPDVTIFVDTPVRVCLERIKDRAVNLEDQFHQRSSLIAARKSYIEALSRGKFVGKLVTADGSGTKSEVLSQILAGMVEELHDDFGLFSTLSPSVAPDILAR